MQRTRPAILLGLLLLAFRAPAQPPVACLLAFAMTSESASPEELTALTYLELVDKVAGAKLSTETLALLAKAENPFEIPEQTGHDLGGLRSQMKRLEAMVREKGWFTPGVLEGIRARLARRLTSERQAERKLDEVVRSEMDVAVALPNPTGMTVSPDGRWVLASTRSNMANDTTPWTVNVYDVKEKKVIPLPGSTLEISHPQFSPDGKNVIFSAPNRLYVVPFHDGALDWSAGRYVGEEKAKASTNRLFSGKNPNLLISGETRKLTLWDLSKGTGTLLDLAPYHDKDDYTLGGAVGYGFVPGTNEVFIQTKGKDGLNRMRSFAIGSDGTVKLKETFWNLNGPPGDPAEIEQRHAFFLSDGTPVSAWSKEDESSMSFYVGKDLKKVRFDFPTRFGATNNAQYARPEVLVHPTKREIVMMYSNPQRTTHFVVHFDLDRQKIRGSYVLPSPFRNIRLSADGEQIYAGSWGNEMLVVNFRQRFDE